MGLRKLFSFGNDAEPTEQPVAEPVLTPVPVAEPKNRRLVSGERLLCRCSLDLPRYDPFSTYSTTREGFIVMNVRGGCLYLPHPLSDAALIKTFPKGESAEIKHFIVYPAEGEPVRLGNFSVRFLKAREGSLTGIVLRFVGMNEKQIDMLNELPSRFPIVEGDEEAAIPLEILRKL